MKNFKSLLPFLLMVFALVGCDTDDLRNDVDELKNRVESLEAQVTAINENMNVLQVLVEGNKTISAYEQTENGYKLTLSDGQVLTLTQGVQGTVSTPSVSVSADGYWVINDQKTTAKAVGSNAPAPLFNVDSEGYWTVDLGDGNGAQRVQGPNGDVKASTDGDVNVVDEFFIDVEFDGNVMTVTYKDGNKYSLEIVPDLLCEIEDPTENFKDNVLTVGYGEIVELKVKVKGDKYFVTAPAGWTAVLSEPSSDTNEATITLKAPAASTETSTLSRASADNTRDLTLQVNKGNSWAVDQIQVVAAKVITSYYAEWQAGNDIVVGQVEDETGDHIVVINNENFKTATLVESDQEITADGLFFIKDGVNVTFKKGALKNSILIGDNPKKRSVVTLGGYLPLKDSGNGFIAKNIDFIGTSSFNYIAQTTGVATFDYFILDNCSLEIPAAKNLLNVTQENSTFSHIALVNSSIKMSSTDFSATRLFNFTKAFSCNSIYVRNNALYSSTEGKAVNASFVYAENLSLNAEVTISNNTLINMISNSKSLVIGKIGNSITIQSNLIWTNYSTGKNATLVNAQDGSTNSAYTISDNIQYNKGEVINFNPFGGTTPSGQSNAKLVPVTEDIFSGEGAEFDLAAGVFIPNNTYVGYGAMFE